MDSALNDASEQAEAAVGEPVVKGQVEHGVARKDLARIHVFIALAGRISGQALERDRHITVNRRDVGMHIGGVSFGMRAGFEPKVVGGKCTVEGESPVHGLTVGRACSGRNAGLLKQQAVRVVHREQRGCAVPGHGQPFRVDVKTSRGVRWVHGQDVRTVLRGSVMFRDDADG